MNRGGKRFEIACYKNKVVDYRQGLETDLSEVLQTDRIFTNVSKGEFAKAKDLQKIFGTKDEEEIARNILSTGQVQVSDKERSQQLEKTIAQISEWISKNCVQPKTNRPYTLSQIRHAMQQANFSVHPTKPLKRQYLDCVKMLQTVIPIERAKMELLLLVPNDDECKTLVEKNMSDNNVEWKTGDDGEKTLKYKVFVDPSLYRVLNEAVQDISGAHIEIVQQIVTAQGDVQLEYQGAGSSTGMGTAVALDGMANIPPAAVNDGTPEVEEVATTPLASQIQGEDESDDEDLMTTSRKQQKKNKKKNRKNQRREDTLPGHGGSGNNDGDILNVSDLRTALAETASSSTNISLSSTTSLTNANASAPTGKSCNTCGGSFDTAAAYRSHFKSDWHRFNQKLKLNGASPISEEEFKLVDSDSFFGGLGEDSIL